MLDGVEAVVLGVVVEMSAVEGEEKEDSSAEEVQLEETVVAKEDVVVEMINNLLKTTYIQPYHTTNPCLKK